MTALINKQRMLILLYSLAYYIVGVEAACVGNLCLKQTRYRTFIDSGQSFTTLPEEIFRKVALEIDRHVNATVVSSEDSPWEYCYETRYTTSVKQRQR